MKKELVTVVIIVITIVALDTWSHNYTKRSFENINGKLDEIKEIGEQLEEGKAKDKENLKEKLDELQEDWSRVNKNTAFYIEHDELEKVNVSMVKFISYFDFDEYGEAIPELENCKYILNHIEDKEKLQLINLF